MKPDQKIPRLQPHYCRYCGAYFEEVVSPNRGPHRLMSQHIDTRHSDVDDLYEVCSRNCIHLEQPEEVKLGRRIYGMPKPNNPVLRSDQEVEQVYNELFPEE